MRTALRIGLVGCGPMMKISDAEKLKMLEDGNIRLKRILKNAAQNDSAAKMC